MSKKTERAVRGPSWTEVILGALLSVVLGAVLGAVLLIVKPVTVVKELPKELAAGTVYYVEGSRETARARQAPAKRKAFAEGQSVSVTEDEINSLVEGARTAAPTPPAKEKPKAGEKAGAAPASAPAGDTLATGVTNVRIRNGVVQVAVPVTVNALGLSQKIIVQARGGFEKKGDVFVFAPGEMYFGSCPVQRLPFVAGYVESKFLAAQPIPDDVAASWRKLANVSVDGNTLKLAMQ